MQQNETVSDLTEKSKQTIGTIGGAVVGATSVRIAFLILTIVYVQKAENDSSWRGWKLSEIAIIIERKSIKRRVRRGI